MAQIPNYLPYGAPGSMSYFRSQPITQGVIPTATDIATQILGKGLIPYENHPGRPFTVCDFGTADGGVSRPLIEACIEKIKKSYGPHTDISVVYEDQKTNDFSGIFQQPIAIPGVFTSVVGRSFYEQCLPSGSLHLGLCFGSMHWMSQLPCVIEDGVVVRPELDSEVKRIFEAQSIEDRKQFLWCRAQELSPGGHMVMAVNIHKSPEFPCAGMITLRRLGVIWKAMQEEGRITKEEFRNTNAIYYHCRLDVYIQQLSEGTVLHKAGLRLKAITEQMDFMNYEKYWPTEDFQDDRARVTCFAGRLCTTVREFSHAVFVGGLSPSKTPQEKRELIDQLYQRFKQHVMDNHAEFRSMTFPSVIVVVEKVALDKAE